MIQRIKGLLKRRGFELFTRPFELNIVGLRNKNTRKADEFHVFYKINAKNWNYHLYEGFTDPFILLKGKNDCILLKEGQYKDAYIIGLHNQKAEALVQSKPVIILQNYHRESFLPEGESKTGMFNIDIIPISALEKPDIGSQVFLANENFKEVMAMCEKHRELYGNQFTYTLIDFRLSKRKLFRKGFAIAASLLTTLFFGYLFKEAKEKKKKKK